MTPAEEVLQESKRAYRFATDNYWRERESGGIIALDRSIPADDEDWKAGKRFKTTTPEAAAVMGRWQKAKAELDAAAFNAGHQRNSAPDRRLPPERDEDEAPL